MSGAQGILAGNETRYLETALRLDIEMLIIIIIDIVIVFVIYGVWLYTKVVYAKHPRISPVGGIHSLSLAWSMKEVRP